MAYSLPNPDRDRTERNRELKRLRAQPAPDRAERAAALLVAFHDDRSLNDVMELAQLVLDDRGEDGGVDLLLRAYLDDADGAEERMERSAMLASVGRWIEADALQEAARTVGETAAVDWCGGVVDETEQADRLSTVERRFDADLRRAVQARL